MIPFVGIFFSFTNTGNWPSSGCAMTHQAETNNVYSRSCFVGCRHRSQEHCDDEDYRTGLARRGSFSRVIVFVEYAGFRNWSGGQGLGRVDPAVKGDKRAAAASLTGRLCDGRIFFLECYGESQTDTINVTVSTTLRRCYEFLRLATLYDMIIQAYYYTRPLCLLSLSAPNPCLAIPKAKPPRALEATICRSSPTTKGQTAGPVAQVSE